MEVKGATFLYALAALLITLAGFSGLLLNIFPSLIEGEFYTPRPNVLIYFRSATNRPHWGRPCDDVISLLS